MQGILNVLKPTGLTSSDVVVRIRGYLRRNYKLKKIKVGHLGTLDPGASGVLPIAIGSATKLFDALSQKEKVYRANITFGKTTETLDSYSEVIATSTVIPTKEDFIKSLDKFIGEIEQIPPKYSAISINGKKAYEMARKGEDFEIPKRKVKIHYIKFIEQISENTFTIDVKCGGGTYIRTLISDIAENLGSCGYMSSLIRLECNQLEIKDSLTLEELRDEVVPLDLLNYLKKFYEVYNIDEKYHKPLKNGVKLKIKGLPNETFLVLLDGELFSIAHSEKGYLINDTRFMPW